MGYEKGPAAREAIKGECVNYSVEMGGIGLEMAEGVSKQKDRDRTGQDRRCTRIISVHSGVAAAACKGKGRGGPWARM